MRPARSWTSCSSAVSPNISRATSYKCAIGYGHGVSSDPRKELLKVRVPVLGSGDISSMRLFRRARTASRRLSPRCRQTALKCSRCGTPQIGFSSIVCSIIRLSQVQQCLRVASTPSPRRFPAPSSRRPRFASPLLLTCSPRASRSRTSSTSPASAAGDRDGVGETIRQGAGAWAHMVGKINLSSSCSFHVQLKTCRGEIA